VVSKYKTQNIVIIVILIFVSTIFFSPILIAFVVGTGYNPSGSYDLTPLLPFNDFQFELPLTLLITMAACIVGALVFGYIFSCPLLFFHKKLIGRKLRYGIQENYRTKKFKETFRGFFPMLMAINFALMILQERELSLLFIDESQIQNSGAGYIYAVFVLVMIISGGTVGIFSSIWFLMDSGIVYVKKKEKRINNPVEIRSVGGCYLTILKGYASISTIITFYLFIFEQVLAFTPSEMIFEWFIIILIIALILLPVFLSLLVLPSLIILDKIYDKRKRYILEYAKKLGIIEKIDSKSLDLVWN